MALEHDQRIYEEAVHVVGLYINQEGLAEEDNLAPDLRRALRILRRAVERRVDQMSVPTP